MKFSFNPLTAKFEVKKSIADVNYRNILKNGSFLSQNLSVESYTAVITHTSTESLKIGVIKVKADTFGCFRVSVNGTVQDYFRTSPLQRNCVFYFADDLKLETGEVLSIEFLPDRLEIPNLNFFCRIEGYI